MPTLANIVLAAAATLAGFLANPATTPAAQGAERFDVIAHRGAVSPNVTENTVASMRRAREHGARTVEVDARITRDGVMVLMHDRSLKRTTRSWGYVDRRTTAQLEHVRTEGGQRIPTVRQALTAARRLGLRMQLEIKEDAAGRWTPQRFANLERMIDDTGMTGRVRLSSYVRPNLRAARIGAPDLQLVFIAYGPLTPRQVLAIADSATFYAGDLTPGVASALRRAGVPFYGHNSNSPADWRVYRERGALGYLTDRY